MSQQTKPGRRTPLSLGQPKGDASDKSQMRANKANLEKISSELLVKQAKNGSTDERIDNSKPENGQNNGNGSTAKKEGNGVHVDASIDNSKIVEAPKQAHDKGKVNDKIKDDKIASPKVNEKTTEKAKSSNEKVPVTNDKQKSSIESVSGISKTEEKVDAKNGEKEVRESVRQKQIREEKEKEVLLQPTKITPSTPEKNNAEPSKVKEKRKSELAAATPTKTPKSTASESLLTEKSLKGFNENLEEAESSRITDSPMPAKDAKILKYSQGPPMSASRTKRSDKLEDASLVVNLSTVSELSNESPSNATPPVERNYSLRQITGRRSTRPLREISFDFRKSYYKERNEFSDSLSNTNVTNSESPRVSSAGQYKRNMEDEETTSPKRSRFDFGLLEFVSSPVKKLGAKFSRSRLSTSTPNKLIVTEDIPSGIEADHFGADEVVVVGDEEVDVTIESNSADNDVDKKMEIDTEIPTDVEAPIEVHEPSKSRCVIM